MLRWLFTHFEELIGSLLLIVICLLAMLQVIGRYAFQTGWAWTPELSGFLMVWLTFIGGSLALKNRDHFVVGVLVDQLSGSARRWIGIGVALLTILFSLLIVCVGIVLTWQGRAAVTPVLQVARSWPYAAMPVGGLLMLIRSIQWLVESWQWQPPSSDENTPSTASARS